jgi:ring-1,2-phenylacetyl-CoA epoxidase subunit PaaA
MTAVGSDELKAKVGRGELVERPEEMTEEYRHELKRMLLIAGDTEFRSVPMIHSYFRVGVPYKYVKSVLAIAQDELGHAHIDYRLLEDLGEDIEALLFQRDAQDWVYPYFFDMPLDNWSEIAVAEGLGEYAGGVLVRNIFHHTSYAPWRRALVKVDLEENFHVKFGQALMNELAQTIEGREGLQHAVDWMFPLLVEFFGPPAKAVDTQLEYRLKGKGTDEMRQQYFDYAVPFCQSLGLRVPMHHDQDQKQYVLEFPFPCAFDPARKQWDFAQPVEWKAVFARWKVRGPMAEEHLRWIRQGWNSLHRWMSEQARERSR